MENEKSFLEEVMKRYLEMSMSVKRMEADQKYSPGCIIKKGPQKQYYYWQRIEEGKLIQSYLKPEQVNEIEKSIKINKWKKQRIKEQKHYITTLKKMLRSIGISEESIMNEYKLMKQKKEQEATQRLIAKEEAGKKRYAENYIHLTDKGEQVASKSELIIANILYSYGIKYEYERPITINGVTYKPDFTIWRPDGTMILWEHAGLMDDPEYARKFENKLIQYQKAGYTQANNLIVTYDEKGSFSAIEVRRMLELYKLI